MTKLLSLGLLKENKPKNNGISNKITSRSGMLSVMDSFLRKEKSVPEPTINTHVFYAKRVGYERKRCEVSTSSEPKFKV